MLQERYAPKTERVSQITNDRGPRYHRGATATLWQSGCMCHRRCWHPCFEQHEFPLIWGKRGRELSETRPRGFCIEKIIISHTQILCDYRLSLFFAAHHRHLLKSCEALTSTGYLFPPSLDIYYKQESLLRLSTGNDFFCT